MNITQPAVSHQVQLLEAYLKLALFHRVGRTKQLTVEGRNYLFFVHEAFEILRAGSQKVVDPDRGMSLTLRTNMAFNALLAHATVGQPVSATPVVAVEHPATYLGR